MVASSFLEVWWKELGWRTMVRIDLLKVVFCKICLYFYSGHICIMRHVSGTRGSLNVPWQKNKRTFLSSPLLLDDRQRGAHGRLAEWVAPTFLYLRRHFHLGVAWLAKQKKRFVLTFDFVDDVSALQWTNKINFQNSNVEQFCRLHLKMVNFSAVLVKLLFLQIGQFDQE